MFDIKSLNGRKARLAVLFTSLFLSGFSSSALAVLTITIDSPQANTVFDPGDTVSITVSFQGAIYWDYVIVDLESKSGDLVDWGMNWRLDQPADHYTWTISFTLPPNAKAGSTYIIGAKVFDLGLMFNAETSTEIKITPPPDTAPPTYPGPGGVISAVRALDDSAANLTWNEARDNQTLASNMVYNVYYAATEGAVFAGAPAQSFTGITSGQVIGLDPKTHFFFGVRARDEAGFEESNTNTALARHYIEAEYGKIEEVFDYSGSSFKLDLNGAENETIGFPESSGFGWGGYCAEPSEGSCSISISQEEGLSLSRYAKAAGSYVYTRFGMPSLPGGLSHAAEVVLNMSDASARAEIELGSSLNYISDVGSEAAVLIRDNNAWWQSSGKTLVRNPSSALDINVFPFQGPDAVTWKRLGNMNDVDEVDDGGEMESTESTSGVPNFGHVEGAGIRILNPTSSAGPLLIRSFNLYGPAPTVPAGVDRRFWTLYE